MKISCPAYLTVMEISTQDGLTVTFDDETGVFSFEWDEETHPEYNFIKDFTDESFATMIRDHIAKLGLPDHVQEASDDSTEVQAG